MAGNLKFSYLKSRTLLSTLQRRKNTPDASKVLITLFIEEKKLVNSVLNESLHSLGFTKFSSESIVIRNIKTKIFSEPRSFFYTKDIENVISILNNAHFVMERNIDLEEKKKDFLIEFYRRNIFSSCDYADVSVVDNNLLDVLRAINKGSIPYKSRASYESFFSRFLASFSYFFLFLFHYSYGVLLTLIINPRRKKTLSNIKKISKLFKVHL